MALLDAIHPPFGDPSMLFACSKRLFGFSFMHLCLHSCLQRAFMLALIPFMTALTVDDKNACIRNPVNLHGTAPSL
jgi:hypothetical protein